MGRVRGQWVGSEVKGSSQRSWVRSCLVCKNMYTVVLVIKTPGVRLIFPYFRMVHLALDTTHIFNLNMAPF